MCVCVCVRGGGEGGGSQTMQADSGGYRMLGLRVSVILCLQNGRLDRPCLVQFKVLLLLLPGATDENHAKTRIKYTRT